MSDKMAMKNYLALKNKSYAIKFDLENTGYTPIENIGTGAYGVVCSAIHSKTKDKVAIKKIPRLFDHAVITKRTYREIKILKHFKHDNIIGIRDILHPGDDSEKFHDIYIILDLMESDLHRIIHSKQELSEEHHRLFLYQILRGLKFIHSANVLHRDLKPSNLLINENCDLKIGDFGMARGLSTNVAEYSMVMTEYVATRWYRAPELIILPTETYNSAVDMWSVGCIFAEMLGRIQLFPGSSHTDQIERIIAKLGTPSKEYLKLTSSNLIRGIILKSGVIKGVSWSQMYPKASKAAIDLLSKMLVLDARKRINVTQALEHPFLGKYHDPDDEPVCIPVFNFDFEKNKSLSLKKAIMEEILDYHKPKPKARQQFDFRPVPKSELSTCSKPKQFNFTPVPKHIKDEQSSKANVLLPMSQQVKPQQPTSTSKTVFLTQVGGSSSSSASLSDGSIERKHQELVQQLQALDAPFQSDDFKKPLSVKVSKNQKPADAGQKSANDIEMLSAKSVSKTDSSDLLNLQVKSNKATDSEMLSAKNKPREEESLEQQKLDTKALIKKALLSNERRKLKDAEAKPKPVTAVQRQREREEKRRQKIEKTKQRKKKSKKEKVSAVELTDEDKKLLEKWRNMQQQQPHETRTHATIPHVPVVHLPTGPTHTTIPVVHLPTGPTHPTIPVVHLPTGPTHTTIPVVHLPTGPTLVQQKDLQPVILSQPGVTLPSQTDSSQQPAVQHPASLLAMYPPHPASSQSSVLLPLDQSACIVTLHSNSVKQHLEGPFPGGGQSSLPFSSYDSWSVPHGRDGGKQTVSRPPPPSYSQALQDKSLSKVDWGGSDVDMRSAGLQPQSEADSVASWLAASLDPAQHQTAPSTSTSTTSDTSSDPLRVITKQLRHSLVEDLTLVNTPKGTGGGYGVASDFDLFGAGASCSTIMMEHRADSAKLSPGLCTDWLELTGNMDPLEFESVLNELSSQELNSVLSARSPKTNKLMQA